MNVSRQARRAQQRAVVRSVMTKSERRIHMRLPRKVRREIAMMTLQMLLAGELKPLR